eukprot:GILJ01006352.1.p1 GENE.GILJ01006352.1~~GILJ01006352.1.p1  ORF type:complete len:890 (-),score=140.80 GILJ01006352.1:316-2832(-)
MQSAGRKPSVVGSARENKTDAWIEKELAMQRTLATTKRKDEVSDILQPRDRARDKEANLERSGSRPQPSDTKPLPSPTLKTKSVPAPLAASAPTAPLPAPPRKPHATPPQAPLPTPPAVPPRAAGPSKPTPLVSADEDDYEDEVFEEYEEDFDDESEDDRDIAKSVTAQTVSTRASVPLKASLTVSTSTANKVGPVPQRSPGLSSTPKEPKMSDIKQALAMENAAAVSRNQSPLHTTPILSPRLGSPAIPNKHLALDGSKELSLPRHGPLDKRRRRARELLEMVTLETESFDVFEQHPLSRYESMVRRLGKGELANAGNQWSEDRLTIETQTDETVLNDKSVQWPEDSGLSSSSKPDPMRLRKFLRQAANVMESLLDENVSGQAYSMKGESGGGVGAGTVSAWSSASVKLHPPTLQYRQSDQVTDVSFAPSHPHLLLAAYRLKADEQTLLAVWDLFSPQRPLKLLLSLTVSRCCCWAPDRDHMVLAGGADGSVMVWDLRESANLHPQEIDGTGVMWPVRRPTYCTDGVLDDSHHAPVVQIRTIGSRSGTKRVADGAERSAFQILSMDAHCVIHVWNVVELPQADIAGSETDLRMGIGGRIKLIRALSLHVESRLGSLRIQQDTDIESATSFGLPEAYAQDIAVDPNNMHNLIVATDSGLIHGSRFGEAPSPLKFDSTHCESSLPVTVTFCPQHPKFFFVGFSNGNISIYHKQHACALASWDDTLEGGVVFLRCCPSRGSVLFVVDSSSTLHVWDLLRNDQHPIITEPLSAGALSTSPPSCMALSEDTGHVLRQVALARGRLDGSVTVDALSTHFVSNEGTEDFERKMLNLATSISSLR